MSENRSGTGAGITGRSWSWRKKFGISGGMPARLVPLCSFLLFMLCVGIEPGRAGTFPEQEPNDSCPGNQNVQCEDIIDPARFDNAGDADWYYLYATAGASITIGTDASSECDPDVGATHLALFADDCGELLASDLNSGPGSYSLIANFIAPYTGYYAIEVQAADGLGFSRCYRLFRDCGPPGQGACCLANGMCQVGTQEQCNAYGGLYQGEGTTCDTNPCQAVAVEPSTWGKIKAIYR